jgi:hypothetical protein
MDRTNSMDNIFLILSTILPWELFIRPSGWKEKAGFTSPPS